jgi:hypothetical protein
MDKRSRVIATPLSFLAFSFASVGRPDTACEVDFAFTWRIVPIAQDASIVEHFTLPGSGLRVNVTEKIPGGTPGIDVVYDPEHLLRVPPGAENYQFLQLSSTSWLAADFVSSLLAISASTM